MGTTLAKLTCVPGIVPTLEITPHAIKCKLTKPCVLSAILFHAGRKTVDFDTGLPLRQPR
jgi:hypothetical protein